MTAARPMDKLTVAAGLICGESDMWHWLTSTELRTSTRWGMGNTECEQKWKGAL